MFVFQNDGQLSTRLFVHEADLSAPAASSMAAADNRASAHLGRNLVFFNFGAYVALASAGPTHVAAGRRLGRLSHCLALSAVIAGTLAIDTTQSSHAQSYAWTNPIGGNYNASLNWSPAGVPNGPGHNVGFALVPAYTVEIDAEYSVNSLSVSKGTVAFDQGGGCTFCIAYKYSTESLAVDPAPGETARLRSGRLIANSSLSIGPRGDGALEVVTGSLTSVGATLGANANSHGTLTLHPRVSWDSTAAAVIGGAGGGRLELLAGTSGGLGATFPAQATAVTPGAVLGQIAGGDGTATVRGIWQTGELTVGEAGSGQVDWWPLPLSMARRTTVRPASSSAVRRTSPPPAEARGL
jgi:hypothetical protein